MSFTKFFCTTAAIYAAYYLIIILIDKLKQPKSVEPSIYSQILEVVGHNEQPKRASLEDLSKQDTDNEKKNSISQPPREVTPDQVQEVSGDDLWYDLGLETIDAEGLEVNEQNILKLINSDVQ